MATKKRKPIFICVADDRSGRGKCCCSSCCCWGGDHFSFQCTYSCLVCEREKLCLKMGVKRRGSADRFGPRRTTTFRVRVLFVRVSPGEPGLGYGPDGRLLEVSEARKPARHGQGQQRQRRIGPDRFVSQHVEPKRGEKEGPLSGSRRSLETRLETFGGNGNRDSLDRFRHPQRNKKRGLWRKRKRQERPFRESLLTKKISLGFSLYGFSQNDCIIILVYFASSPVSRSKREMST